MRGQKTLQSLAIDAMDGVLDLRGDARVTWHGEAPPDIVTKTFHALLRCSPREQQKRACMGHRQIVRCLHLINLLAHERCARACFFYTTLPKGPERTNASDWILSHCDVKRSVRKLKAAIAKSDALAQAWQP